ncbi:hypothetical protein [Stakelama tenebrarum]|uniref:Secreted protein n=1 Tax=Stakelama tenebrarum TaxID=2711215 RepID=A0A6G6Y3G3_9SPHN|nr:hypothetical protein [Sphingosinithalassobacter tenebrarum]QIG79472.1 hypothetical protein G5C33_06500 [Sphingosinithalassobacter tenebrarum]
MKTLAGSIAAAALATFAPVSAHAQSGLEVEFVRSYDRYPQGASSVSACLDTTHRQYVDGGAVETARTTNARWYSTATTQGKGKFLMYCANAPGVVGLGVRIRGNPPQAPSINYDTHAHYGQADCMRRARGVANASRAYSVIHSTGDSVTLYNGSSNLAVTVVCTGFGEVMFAGWGLGGVINERQTVDRLWRQQ